MAEVKDELFLDLLTKEEREALLNKKMEEIRKKNDALRKRHQEIEADKKYAAKLKVSTEESSSANRDNYRPQKTPSPRKEFVAMPGEDKKTRISKPGGRGRGRTKKEEPIDHTGDFRVIRWEFNNKDPELAQTPEVEYTDAFPGRGRGYRKFQSSSDPRRRPYQRRVNDQNRFSFPQLRQDRSHEDSDEEEHHWEREQHAIGAGGDNRFNRKPREIRNNLFSPSSPAATAGRGRLQELSQDGSGPPPDPAYNFLSDRRRESSNQERESRDSARKETRRHPKNFGGQDFGNVPAQMRERKERQERPKSGPPRTKLEMSLAMTGRERLEYTQWKEERERIDSERLARQKSQTGEWRRAWDAEKNQQDFEETSSTQRTEPAKRPAGRIGSGRFDRGERDDRHRVDGPARQKGGVKQEQDQLTPKSGRGRARGRGRGRGRGSPRPRTFSGGDETRKVECQKDLLVVKIDNSGKEQDHSVEVEYWDDDLTEIKSVGKTPPPGPTHAPPSQKQTTQETDAAGKQFQAPSSSSLAVKDQFTASVHDMSRKPGERTDSQSQSAGDENDHDESWEDCPDSSEFYGTTDDESRSQSSHKDFDKGEKGKDHHLKLKTKLNPDAAEFQPSPPDSSLNEFLPTSPDFMKTPPGHVKVMDWVSEVTDNLSPTSPPPMEGYHIRKEDFIQKDSQMASFNADACQDDLAAKSSSAEEVTKDISQTSSNEQINHKNLEHNDTVCEEEGDELFEIAPEDGEGPNDEPSLKSAEAPETFSSASPEVAQDVKVHTDDDSENNPEPVETDNSVEASNLPDQLVLDSKPSDKEVDISSLAIETENQTETKDVEDSKPELDEDSKPELDEDTSTPSIEEISVNEVHDDSHKNDVDEVNKSDSEVSADLPEESQTEDSSETSVKESESASIQMVPSPSQCETDPNVKSSDQEESETVSTQDVIKDTCEKTDDHLSEPIVPSEQAAIDREIEDKADESATEQKSSTKAESEGADKEPSTTTEDRSAAESPLSS